MRYDKLLEAVGKKMKEKNIFDALTIYVTETRYGAVTNYELKREFKWMRL
ncbi:MAG: hypothetical protein V1689_00440 [Pseudomonadota bacterium]